MSPRKLSRAQREMLAALLDGTEKMLASSTGDALRSRGLVARRTAPSANEKGYVCWYRILPEGRAALGVELAELARAAVVAEGYELDDSGVIRSPGRYEGEPWYVAAVELADQDGDSEPLTFAEDGIGTYSALVTPSELDKLAWGLRADTVAILFENTDSGFRHVSELTEPETVRARASAEEAFGPCGGDYTMQDARVGGVYVSVVDGTSRDMQETFFDEDAALRAIRARMERDKYWPNVWRISDHGNAHLSRDPFAGLDS